MKSPENKSNKKIKFVLPKKSTEKLQTIKKLEDEKKVKMAKPQKIKKKEKREIEKLIKEDKKQNLKWLKKNLIVKIKTKFFNSRFYDKKGIVKRILTDGEEAEIEVLKSKELLKLSIDHLETVVPRFFQFF
ncbi:hypothetical protein MHBO_004556 [Bonamia ostreae]|uniref:KN17 SH3-like domain-containing protein n=1 Tax=Bonamia ostreae TaxID=126728 RepID=A0ABV2ATQ4_9EUKA